MGQQVNTNYNDFDPCVEIVSYRGRCIWTLSDSPGFPWCAWVHCEHKEYKTLEEAKADIDLEQDNLK